MTLPFQFHERSRHLARGAAVVIALATLFQAPMLHAGAWQRCQLELTIQKSADKSQIQAKVDAVRPSANALECPARGDVIRFTPETSDYQEFLPRKQWPKVGSKVRWRYIYLHGFCKNDGNPAACVIRHYPKGWGE